MGYYVDSGEMSTGIILNADWMYIDFGGTANNTTINSGGSMYIGGVANNTTVNSGGSMYIGGVANNTTVNSGGYLSCNGTATNIIENGGYVDVYFYGGYATFASNTIEGMVLSRTRMTVHKNTIANNTTINSGGIYVFGGIVNSTTVNSGSMYISSGGMANNTTINSRGRMYISSGGGANNTTINSGCGMDIDFGGTANSTTVNSGGGMRIGGTANSTTINFGYMYVSSGGMANNTTINSGSMYISSVGVANKTTINSGGYMYIYFGVANSTTINSGGGMTIDFDGTANSTTVNSSGYMVIYSGGGANNTTVNSGGGMTIDFDGTANLTTVNSGGSMVISSGAIFYNLTINSGGYLSVYDYDTIYNATINPGATLQLRYAGKDFNITLTNVAIHNIGNNINYGDHASFSNFSVLCLSGGAICNDYYSWHEYGPGGEYDYITKFIYGTMTFGDFATFTNNSAYDFGGAIYNTGTMTFGDSATFTNNSAGVFDACVYYISGGGAICNFSSMLLGDHATFINNTAGVGGAIYNTNSMTLGDHATFKNNTAGAGGAIYNTHSMTLGDYVMFTNNSGGAIYNSGSMILGDSAVFSGNINENDAGAIYNTGNITIGDYAVFMDNLNIPYKSDNGYYYGVGGAIVNNGGGNVTVGSTAIFTNNTAVSGGAILNCYAIIYSSSNEYLAYGSMTLGDSAVFSGNKALHSGGAIVNYGDITIGNHAVFIDNLVTPHEPYGNGYYYGKGGAILNYGGNITIGSSATFTNNLVILKNEYNGYCDGGAIVNYNSRSYDYGSQCEVEKTGSIIFDDYAKFTNNSARRGGAIFNEYGSITLGESAVFSENIANDGGAIFNNGGDIVIGDNVTFKGNSASYYGGAIYNTSNGNITLGDAVFATHTDTIYNEGDLILNGDVSFAGNITLAEYDNTGSLQNNGNMDFNISVRYAEDGLLLNDWTRVSGDGTYSLTIGDKQVAGEYQLIGNAANFAEDLVITVRNEDGSKKGELSLDMEKPLELRNMDLMLVLDETTNIISVIVDSEYSKKADREKQETKIELPSDAFSGMSYDNYTLTQAPDWLTIDASTGKFSGTTGKITDTDTGYGTTEVIIQGTRGEETKEHVIEVVVVPETIKGDGSQEGSLGLTDVVAEVMAKREERSNIEITFEDDIAWEYAGLGVKLSDISADLIETNLDYEIKLHGKLNLTIFDPVSKQDDKPGLTVDFSGDDGDKYIKIVTPLDFDGMKVDVVGDLTFRNLILSDGFFLKEGFLSVNTETDTWSGSAEVEFTYFDKIVTGEYEVVNKKANKVSIGVSGLDIALGTTGFFLTGIAGQVDHISDGEGIELSGDFDFTYGKEIGDFSIAEINLSGTITTKSVSGTAQVSLAEGVVSGTVSATLDWSKKSFSGNGSITLLNLCTVQSGFTIDSRGNFMLAGRRAIDFSNYGLNISVMSDILLKFTNDGNSSNDYYMAWSTQTLFGNEVMLGVKFAFDGSFSLIGSNDIKALSVNSPIANYAADGATPDLASETVNVKKGYVLTGTESIVLFSIQWSSGTADIILTDANGKEYTLDAIQSSSDMQIVESMSSETSKVIAVKNAAAGTWYLEATAAGAVIGCSDLSGSKTLNTPELMAEKVSETSVTLSWDNSVLSEGSTISIYCDSDGDGYDGILVTTVTASEAQSSYTFDTEAASVGGTLYFYTVVTDDENGMAALGDYSGSVTVKDISSIVEIKENGKSYVGSGTSAVSAVVSSGAAVYVEEGQATALQVLYGGEMNIYNSGTAENTVIRSDGQLNVLANGYANNTCVDSYGSMTVSSGGTANNTDVTHYFGRMHISSGGIANTTTVGGCGGMYISSGAMVNNTTINGGGSVYISSGGTANSTNINSGGNMYIDAGGTADNTTVNSGGWLYFYSDGMANSTNINSDGFMTVSSGGTANSTNINSGGNMYIDAGGTADNTTVNSGGWLCISSGGKHRGALQIEAGADVYVYTGGIIDFTVADRTSTDDYLINDLSRIYGTPTYTITVSADQEAGTYKLAQGASALEGTITICTTDTCFGELTINGDTLIFDGVTYDLNNVDGNLTLTITKPETEYVIGNFNGMFEFTPDGSGTLYTSSGKQEITGTLDTDEWGLIGAGDFNKSGTDGLLWIEKNTGYVYVQNDLSSFDEVNNMSNCLGVLGDGYEILSTGDFTGTGIDGVIMQGPAFGDASVSLNYGLPIWGREADGTTFAGWLGALVNTWQPGDTLKGDTSDLADINAKNYMYEVVSVGDYNGDGVDDVMLQNIMPENVDGVTITGSGDVFTFLTGSMDAVKAGAAPTVAYAGCATDGWEIKGSGDFNGDGIDDVLLSDGTGVAGWQMANGQRIENQWFGNLGANEKVAGITDLNNDGTDDILILNTATDTYSGWLVKDGVITGSLAIA